MALGSNGSEILNPEIMNTKFNLLSWAITWGCNAVPLCDYCIARTCVRKRNHPIKENILNIIDGLSRLPSKFHINIGGGEPFSLPYFLSIVTNMIDNTPHEFMVTTNFIESSKLYEKFINITSGRLVGINATYHFHLFQNCEQLFLEKSKIVKNLSVKKGFKFKVNFPLIPNQKAISNIESMSGALEDEGITTYVQHLKNPYTQKPVEYPSNIKRKVEEILGNRDLTTSNPSVSFKGQLCEAGSTYFQLNPLGSAYICCTSLGMRDRPFGKITERSFRLFGEPIICPYDTCNCASAWYCGARPDAKQKA